MSKVPKYYALTLLPGEDEVSREERDDGENTAEGTHRPSMTALTRAPNSAR
jgi:hypothetical protein